MEVNKIYNEDCLLGLAKIPDKSIDLVVTDPPYLHTKGRGINRETGKAYADGHSKFANSDLYSTKGFMMGEMSTFGEEQIDKVLTEYVRVCKIPNMYIFCNETQVPYYTMWAEKHNLMFSILVWEKPLSIINRNRFSQNIEFIIRIYDYGTALNRLYNVNDVYNRVQKVNQVTHSEKVHPTQKPLSIVEGFILLSSNEGDVVLDSFCGSGTTAVACVKNKRNYICFEKEEKFYNIALQRVQNEQSQLCLF